MGSKYVANLAAEGNLLEHPAVLAWSALRTRSVRPEAVIVLKEHRRHPWEAKTAAYRLVGVGPNGKAVIAKRCRRGRAELERTLYEDLLPGLSVPAPACYGCLDVPGGDYRWLFTEDVQGAAYSSDCPEHRAAAACWLAHLHTSGRRVSRTDRLPDRGPRYTLGQLQSSYRCLSEHVANPVLQSGDVQVLQALLRDLEFLDSHWRHFAAVCEAMPQTLVHGDFADKNIRTRTTVVGTTIIPFDWEFSGWGAPAADIAASARPDLDVYGHAVREAWPALDDSTLQRLMRVGTLFRLVAWIDWIAPDLRSAWVERPMRTLELYQFRLHQAIQHLRQHDGPL